ncbi:hypothetical protein CDAR_501661 [Caerostris darwini]|uniref:Uncharacterized protein n=1 Tax=Caerostris darwini TaxID=1538125 RepID=A0AAV4TRG3_9ARAC|nr:hypothetical protein CDAR_501661 [Caerostris darwini]
MAKRDLYKITRHIEFMTTVDWIRRELDVTTLHESPPLPPRVMITCNSFVNHHDLMSLRRHFREMMKSFTSVGSGFVMAKRDLYKITRHIEFMTTVDWIRRELDVTTLHESLPAPSSDDRLQQFCKSS